MPQFAFITMRWGRPGLWHSGLMADFKQSNKLHNVLYDIRGPLLEHAKYMVAEQVGKPLPL